MGLHSATFKSASASHRDGEVAAIFLVAVQSFMYIIISWIGLCFVVEHRLDLAITTDSFDHLLESTGLDEALIRAYEGLCPPSVLIRLPISL